MSRTSLPGPVKAVVASYLHAFVGFFVLRMLTSDGFAQRGVVPWDWLWLTAVGGLSVYLAYRYRKLIRGRDDEPVLSGIRLSTILLVGCPAVIAAAFVVLISSILIRI